GEAAQGVAAEGTPAGAGASRADVGQRSHGSHSVGAGVTKGKRVSEVVVRRAAARNRGKRGRTARQTGSWLWQDSVRAEENCGGQSPRCAGYAIAGRFLATETPTRQRMVEVLSGRPAGSLETKEVVLRKVGQGEGFNFFAGGSWWAEHQVARINSS